MQSLLFRTFVFCFVVSSFFVSCTGILLAADSKDEKKNEIKFESVEIDYRDAIIKASTKGKFNLIITPEIKGTVNANLKKISTADTLKLFAKLAKAQVIEKDGFTIVTFSGKTFPTPGKPVTLTKDKKFKKATIRKADIRETLSGIFKDSETDVILGQSVKGHVVLRTEEVEASKMVNILLYAAGLTSKKIDTVLFIGTKQEIDEIIR